jgi:hypothetical protein
MYQILQIKELSESGFVDAVRNGDSVSKQFFLEILMMIEKNTDLRKGTVQPDNNQASFAIASSAIADGSVRSRVHKRVKDPKDVNIVAYFLSKYEHHDLFIGQNYNQSETFTKASELLGVPMGTLRNIRDAFDRYTSSHRVGWDKPLNALQQKIFDAMENKQKSEVLEIVQGILAKGL